MSSRRSSVPDIRRLDRKAAKRLMKHPRSADENERDEEETRRTHQQQQPQQQHSQVQAAESQPLPPAHAMPPLEIVEYNNMLTAEYNDGTHSPYPEIDAYDYQPDAYTAAYLAAHNAMSKEEEAAYLASDDYKHFAKLLQQGTLVLRSEDLSHLDRWRCLGFFLVKNPDVSSVRFDGVDLQRGDLHTLKQVLLQCAHASRLPRPRPRFHYATTDSSSSSCSSSPAPPTPTTATIGWTGGWGLDIDQYELNRRRNEWRLRHITFVGNNLGTRVHPYASQQEVKTPRSAVPSTPLQNVASLLLLFELLETCNIWRNNLNDEHARELCEQVVPKHPSLQKLSLRWNGITAEGAEQIEAILLKMQQQQQSNSSGNASGKFESLDLSCNRIDDPTDRLFASKGAFHVIRTGGLQAASSPTFLPSKRSIYVNLQSQMPPSARALGAFLRHSLPQQTCATAHHLASNAAVPLFVHSHFRPSQATPA